MAKQDWIIEAPSVPEPVGLKRLGAGIGGGLTQGVANILGVPAAIQQLAGGPQQATGFAGQPLLPFLPKAEQLPTGEQLGSQLKETLGIPQVEPENLAERFLFRAAETAPSAALAGTGLLIPALGSSVGAVAEEFGVPKELADVAQLGTEVITSALRGKIPTIRSAKKIQDSLVRIAGQPGTKEKATMFSNAVNEVGKALETETSRKVSKQINHLLKVADENLTKGKIDPVKAMDLRASLYNTAKELPENLAAKYINPLTKGLNEFFAVYAAENPTFYKHLTARDKLTMLNNMNLVTKNFIDKLGLSIIPGGKITSEIIGNIIGEGERFIRGIATNSAARKYYFDAVLAGANKNPTLLAKNLNNLANEMPEIKPQEISESGWIIE